jgi:hypothetical protein
MCITSRSNAFSYSPDQGRRSKGHDLDIMDPPRDRAHRHYPDVILRCRFSFGQINPPEAIRERSLERAMAVHHDCGNREDLHQEARVTTSIAITSVRLLALQNPLRWTKPRYSPASRMRCLASRQAGNPTAKSRNTNLARPRRNLAAVRPLWHTEPVCLHLSSDAGVKCPTRKCLFA